MDMDKKEASTSSSCGLSRKCIGITCVVIAVLAIIATAVAVPLSKKSATSVTNLEKAKEILSEVPLIDGHNDLAMLMYNERHNNLDDFTLDTGIVGKFELTQTDIPRLRAGHVGAQFWSLYISCNKQYKDAVRACLDQCDTIHRFIERYDDFEYVTTAQGIEDAFKNGKIGSLLGMESGHCLDSSLGTLRMFYKLGVRYVTLTHNCNTPWADNNRVDHPTSPDPADNDGLSDFGKDLVREMNRLGIFVDLSHTSHKTQEDAFEVSEAPVIYSHSSAYSLCGHRRNVKDEMLAKMKDNGGLVMVNFYPYFITCEGAANVSSVADHVEYIRDKAGIDHIGIGGDFDGIEVAPEGLEDVTGYPNLFAELVARGWSDEDLKKLAGNNLLRAMRDMESVSEALRATNQPDEQTISESDMDMTCRHPYP